MEFACFNKANMQYIGMCRLPKGIVDPPGTGHSFGHLCYTLLETDEAAGIMYFKLDAIQPYLDE